MNRFSSSNFFSIFNNRTFFLFSVILLISFVCPSIISAKDTSAESIRIWKGVDDEPQKFKVKMHVYLPEKSKATGKAAIILPGGSYIYMGIEHEGHEVARFLNEHGIAGFVLNYRTAMNGSHHPAMIEDVQQAFNLIEENAAKYGVDTKKLGVIGFSAGGHLAGTAATYFDTNFLVTYGIEPRENFRPAFAAMIYPVITMYEPHVHVRSRRHLLGSDWRKEEMRRMMSLEKNVRSDMPPIFLVQCKGDKTVDFHNAVMFDEALTQKNVPHEFLLFDEEGHGFGLSEKKYPGNKAWTWRDRFVEWIKIIDD